ncbi:MAG: Peptidyl-prolyl cis-trans isomerase PpiD [Myxococcaceae bacterium]|nr:Peptidyl-prolyl cis-trans isomerase PpiD [Myxococcaceae bacterium]
MTTSRSSALTSSRARWTGRCVITLARACLGPALGSRLCLSLCLASSALGCHDKVDQAQPAAVGETKHGLSSEQAKQPLVVIGDTAVTVGDFAEQLADKSPYLRARYASPERRRELLEELVKFELLAKEAQRRGLDNSDEVLRTKRQLMVQQMMKAEFEDKVKLSDITEAEIAAYYEAHPDEFHKPEQVRASVIVTRDEAKAKKVLKQVLDARSSKEDNELFRSLASSLDQDPALRERFGDLQFFSRPSERKEGEPEVPEAVANAAFKLDKIGDIAPEPIKTPQGFCIVKLTGKRKALARSLDQTRRTIQHKLWRERREAAVEAFVRSLRSQAQVQENWALLEQVKVDLPVLPGTDAGTAPPRTARGRPDAGGSGK